MIREAERGFAVGRGLRLYDERVSCSQRIGNGDRDVSRITLLAIGAHVEKPQRWGAIGAVQRLRSPNALVEPDAPPVQMIGAVVSSEDIGAAVQREVASADSPRNAADDRSKIGMRPQVVTKVVESEHDVVHASLAIRHPNGRDDSPIGQDREGRSRIVGQGIGLNGFTGSERAKGARGHAAMRSAVIVYRNCGPRSSRLLRKSSHILLICRKACILEAAVVRAPRVPLPRSGHGRQADTNIPLLSKRHKLLRMTEGISGLAKDRG